MRWNREERKRRRVRLIIGIFIVAVMVLSTFGIMANYSSPGTNEKHNGIRFRQAAQDVVANIDGALMKFNFFPSQVQEIPVEGQIANVLRNVPTFYITSNPHDALAPEIDQVAVYWSSEVARIKNVIPVPAFTNATGYERPGVTCANATAAVPVIDLAYGNKTEIVVQESCIRATARDSRDLFRIHERLLFVLLGVLDE